VVGVDFDKRKMREIKEFMRGGITGAAIEKENSSGKMSKSEQILKNAGRIAYSKRLIGELRGCCR